MSEEDLKKKLEDYHESMLKNAAVTFTLEGLSKDLKFFLQKKMTYNTQCLQAIVDLAKTLASSGSSKINNQFLSEDSILQSMIKYSYSEMRLTDMMLNMIIQKIFEKEISISIEDTSEESKTQKTSLRNKKPTKPTKE